MQKKKLLGSALALSLFFPTGAINAELLKNFKLSGQLDLSGTAANNVRDFASHAKSDGTAVPLTLAVGATARDRIGLMQTRLMLTMDWDLLDDVHSKITLGKNDRNWGDPGNAIAHPAASQAIGAAGVEAATFVDQAYIKIDKVFGAADATMGRQFYGEPGDLIAYFGPSDKAQYGLPVTALDALRVDWGNDMLGLTGVAGKIAASAGLAVPQGGTDLRGITAMLKGQENMSLGAYLYNQVTHNVGSPVGTPPGVAVAGGKNDFLWVLGAKVKYMLGNAWVGGEFAKNFGANRQAGTTLLAAARNYTGWAFKLDGGVKADVGMATVSPWGHFGFGTGDNDSRSSSNKAFQAIAGDYRPGSIYGRFSDNLGTNLTQLAAIGVYPTTLQNRVIWGLGVKATPASMSKLTAGLSLWDFRSQTQVVPNPAANGDLLHGNKHLGTELDLDLTWKHSENVTFDVGAARAMPGGAIKDAIQSTTAGAPTANSGIGVNSISLAYFDVRLKF